MCIAKYIDKLEKKVRIEEFKGRRKLPKSYEERWYLYDLETGERLRTTVMEDGDEKIVGHGNVIKRLRIRILDKAKELGGKDLRARDFIDVFKIRGPNFGDVVRQVMGEFECQGKIKITNVGTENKKLYRYDVV